jgi:chemotaxis protein CheD
MKEIILGVGEYKATNMPGECLKTYALGSCVAIIFLDAEHRSVGMAHIALPDSVVNPDRAVQYPAYFADTGVPILLKEMKRLGYSGAGRKMKVKLAGGASMLDDDRLFNIGERNLAAIRKILFVQGLSVSAEDVGGKISRNVSVDADTGAVMIQSRGIGTWNI